MAVACHGHSVAGRPAVFAGGHDSRVRQQVSSAQADDNMKAGIYPLMDFSSHLRSAVAGVVWPAVPSNAGATALAVQHQLEQSQWWPAAELERQQLRQLQGLLRHAHRTIPFWRDRLAAAGFDPRAELARAWFSTLPLLTRDDVQLQGEALLCRSVPQEHGAVVKGETSGSTGKPVVYFGTELTRFFWRAFTLREHLWHQRNLSGRLAVIRARVENVDVQGWGPSTDAAFTTGPCSMLNIFTPVGEQVNWLLERDPEYLLSHASNAHALAKEFFARGRRLPKLHEVRTIGEVVTSELRRACREAWGVRLVDIYSAQEVGYIALQCPEHEHYHVQSENLLVEILDEGGRACDPGQTGSVVITALHNFAMPLIRYEIGDYATVGENCACGRGLPVISRVLGRVRNMLTLPNGDRRWPTEGFKELVKIAPIKQFQLVQKDLQNIEVNLVVEQSLSAEAERMMEKIITSSLGHPFRLTFKYPHEIPRGASGKFEDFRSEIAG